MPQDINDLLEEIDGAISTAAQIVNNVCDMELGDPLPDRYDMVVATIKKKFDTTRKTRENIAALAAYALMKNEPFEPKWDNFNYHVAILVALGILQKASRINESDLTSMARNSMSRFGRLDLTEARSLLERWVTSLHEG